VGLAADQNVALIIVGLKNTVVKDDVAFELNVVEICRLRSVRVNALAELVENQIVR
jgi:hypothetical protein